jgi:hypothetical protein
MNAYKEDGSLNGGFKPHIYLCKGPNDAIMSKEEDIENKWEIYFQDLLKQQKLDAILPSITQKQMK